MRTVDALSIATVLASLVVGCSGSPTQPRNDGAPSGTPLATRLEVTGPREVPPAASAQFTATAHYSDGPVRDVTSQASWISSNLSLLTITNAGLATGRSPGDTNIRASYQGHVATREVIVVPAGTFRLTGRVTEADDSTLPIAGARVEVAGGSGPSPSTTTGADGRYRLYGVASEGELRVEKEGFHRHVQHIRIADHDTLDVALRLAQPRPDVSGRYVLRLTAAPECQNLPDQARSRVYTAIVTQTGPRVSATLHDATFFTVGGSARNRFSGTMEADRVTFLLHGPEDYYYYYHAELMEQLAPSLFFVASGSVAAAISPAGFSGPLAGTLEVREPSGPSRFKVITTCRSSNHRFALER